MRVGGNKSKQHRQQVSNTGREGGREWVRTEGGRRYVMHWSTTSVCLGHRHFCMSAGNRLQAQRLTVISKSQRWWIQQLLKVRDVGFGSGILNCIGGFPFFIYVWVELCAKGGVSGGEKNPSKWDILSWISCSSVFGHSNFLSSPHGPRRDWRVSFRLSAFEFDPLKKTKKKNKLNPPALQKERLVMCPSAPQLLC